MVTLTPKRLIPQIIYRGATFRGRLAITNTDGTVKNLTGAAVRWQLFDAEDLAMFSPEKSLGSGIAAEGGDLTPGVLLVDVDNDETENLGAADYTQEWFITDSAGDVQIYRGQITIAKALMWVP